jgi:hypothetical protein
MSLNSSPDTVPPGDARKVPLTANQKLQLVAGCLPLMLYCVAAPIYVYYASLDMREPLNLAWAGVCLLIFGFLARNWLRDLFFGAALVREANLKELFYSSGSYCADFAQIGTLTFNDKRVQATTGRRYRVFYSPASRLIWKLELVQA